MANFDSSSSISSIRRIGGDVFAQLLAYFEELSKEGRNLLKFQLPTVTTEQPRTLDLNMEESASDPVDLSQNLNSILDISSAIKSVAANGMWNFGKMQTMPKLFWAPGHEENKTPLIPPIAQATTEEEPEEEDKDNEEGEPIVTFQSKYIHKCPLYQDYCVQSVRDDLQKLNTKTFLSELISPEYLRGLQSRLSPKESPWQSSSGSSSPSPPDCHVIRVVPCTLWQDLDEVKAAGLLSTMTVQQIRLQESMFELISSEASYLRSLSVTVDHFFSSKALKRTLSQMEHHTLFSNVRHVKVTSEKFLMDLEMRLGECVMISQLGDIVLDHCPAFRARYVPYITNMMYQEALINQLLQQNRDFESCLKQLESEPVCQRQTLKSFLVLPFQRITRIKLILENILKLTEADSDGVSLFHKAKEAIHEIVVECNEGIKKMKVIEQLISLEVLLDFGNLKALPLVVSGRFLVHNGPLSLLTVESSPQSRMLLIDIHLHLFNDLLILSTKKEQRFLVEDHAEFPTYVHVAPLKTEELGLPPESFLLHLSRSCTGNPTAMILVAHSRTDQEQWLRVLKADLV
ncbi:rho guanine nucleotide exchange factor 19 [Syngnathus typhle]|uniref:rho guanine nucleotide exchange factor 19 n=1 Tax=Syngnathus typhle TaxID=161592 RepID=UPI002A6ABA89|nr:rho guanine nucleotide exchange factor 19 [Syngnathus typhle]